MLPSFLLLSQQSCGRDVSVGGVLRQFFVPLSASFSLPQRTTCNHLFREELLLRRNPQKGSTSSNLSYFILGSQGVYFIFSLQKELSFSLQCLCSLACNAAPIYKRIHVHRRLYPGVQSAPITALARVLSCTQVRQPVLSELRNLRTFAVPLCFSQPSSVPKTARPFSKNNFHCILRTTKRRCCCG